MRSKLGVGGADLALLAAVAGVALTGGLPWPSTGLPAVEAPLPERFPAFEMTREVTTSEDTSVFHLVYVNQQTWKETLVGSTATPDRVGGYQEVRDGSFVGQEHAAAPGDGYRVPGPWFGDAQWFIRRGNAADGAVVTHETRGRDQVVTIARGSDRTEIRFDTATGIPVSYEIRRAGTLVERHEVTLLRSGGQTIR